MNAQHIAEVKSLQAQGKTAIQIRELFRNRGITLIWIELLQIMNIGER